VTPKKPVVFDLAYPEFVAQLVGLLEQARRSSARSVNAIMTGTYWEVGRRIVEQEQRGKRRAQYGKALLHRLAQDLTTRFGKGFSERNLLAMREFYLAWRSRAPGQARSEIRRHCLRIRELYLSLPPSPAAPNVRLPSQLLDCFPSESYFICPSWPNPAPDPSASSVKMG
jgi:hypothetical protein